MRRCPFGVVNFLVIDPNQSYSFLFLKKHKSVFLFKVGTGASSFIWLLVETGSLYKPSVTVFGS